MIRKNRLIVYLSNSEFKYLDLLSKANKMNKSRIIRILIKYHQREVDFFKDIENTIKKRNEFKPQI